MTSVIENNAAEPYAAYFAGLMSDPLAGLSHAIRNLRREGFSRLEEMGFPSQEDEDWRFLNVSPIVRGRFLPPPPAAAHEGEVRALLDSAAIAGLDSYRVVFVNGRFRKDLSSLAGLPKAVFAGSLAEALASPLQTRVEEHLGKHLAPKFNGFAALNAAMIEDGAVIFVPRGGVLDKPLELVFVSVPVENPFSTHPRNLVLIEPTAQASVIETYIGEPGAAYFTNAATEVLVSEGARLSWYKVQREAQGAYHVAATQIVQERDSTVAHLALNFGGAIVRNDINLYIGGEGATGVLDGLYMISGRQWCDTHTRIDHAKPNCESHELYKGILDDNARGVFNGRIYVHQDAQKTDAKQTNQTLLLSDTAQINANPQLEIFADDVKCTHGATIGQIDEDHVFYLQTRGIPKDEAKSLLTYAFANDIVRRIAIDPLRVAVEKIVLAAREAPTDFVI
ncbi:MAG: Fe-S cluster assembly protein SufD [Candidatus Sumerlaeaceae bacterium]|nr:Fe-S cluster assembly protein SufD [Candidatus Sumerlaeaceae bacterium]